MSQKADAEDLDVAQADIQIPHKVAAGKCHYQAAGAGISPHTTLPVHLRALIVGDADPEGQGVNKSRLEERDNVDIPVDAGALVELRVDGREQACRQPGRDDGVCHMVEQHGKQQLVDVQRQSLEGHVVGEGLDGLLQGRGGLEREGIEHAGEMGEV